MIAEDNQKAIRDIGHTIPAALAAAHARVPENAEILDKRAIVAPRREAVSFDASDAESAREYAEHYAKGRFGDNGIVENLKLVAIGRRKWFGTRQEPNQYEAEILRQATAQIIYKVKAGKSDKSPANSLFGEDEGKRLVETLLRLGSVSYALGFLTVMLHTARLGIPVIELIKPVYIWIGLPLAPVVFCSVWLWKLLKSRIEKFIDELQTVKNDIFELLQKPDIESKDISRLLDLYFNLLTAILSSTLPLNIFSHFILNSARKQLKNRITRIDQETPVSKRLLSVAEKGLGSITSLFRGYAAINQFLNFVGALSLIPLGCFLYIFVAYPSIPQSFGGGKPIPVMLFVDAQNIPMDSPQARALFPPGTLPLPEEKNQTIATIELELMYETDEEYYIRATDQLIIALDKGIVKGILWLPNHDIHRENSDTGLLPLMIVSMNWRAGAASLATTLFDCDRQLCHTNY